MNNLRMTLLGEIINNNGLVQNKYSMAYNNLSAVIKLEIEEVKDKLSNNLFNEFKLIKKKSCNLSKEVQNIPFLILEQYYFRNFRDLNKEIYIEWKEISFEIKIKELFLLLENFYLEIYFLAIKIADYYNLEFKLKNNNNNKDSDYI